MKKMLLLGGTGFIGREVVRVAADAGWQVAALSRSEAGDVLLRRLGAAPVRGDAADYIENAAALALLLYYPNRLDGVASVAGVFTLAKHGLYWGSTLLVLYGLARAVLRSGRRLS